LPSDFIAQAPADAKESGHVKDSDKSA
jgi:hypothetical protein